MPSKKPDASTGLRQESEGWLERRRGWVLAALLGASLVLRVWLALTGGQRFWPDEGRYRAAEEAAYHLARGETREAWSELIGTADHLFFKVAGVPMAWWELRDGQHAAGVAIYFGLFSVLGLWLVYGIARSSGASPREGLFATFLAAGANSLFYYSRHFFPYDLALFFCLLALWLASGGPAWWRSVVAGLAVGFGFLSYNGYWVLGGAILTWQVFSAPNGRGILVRALGAGMGLLVPLVTAILAARALGHDLVASFRQFSGTIIQGDFGRGYVFVWQYLWDAEGVVLVGWLGLALGGLWLARASGRHRARLWLGAAAVCYLVLVVCSDGLRVFVVYGRTARVLVPFLCLAAAVGAEEIFSRRPGVRWGGMVLLAAMFTVTGMHFAQALRQVFPADFLRLAAVLARTSRGDHPGLLRLLNAERLEEGPVMEETRPHETLLRGNHPWQFRPYLYEGITEAQREKFSDADISMRLIVVPGVLSAGEVASPAWRLRLRFPQGRRDISEPLMTGGTKMRANFLFVHYLDETHVRFGYDAWGLGGATSRPVKIDYASEHELVFAAGLPRDPNAAPSGEPQAAELFLAVDGQTILLDRKRTNPTDADSVFIGLNFIGGSTADESFSGEILALENISLDELHRVGGRPLYGLRDDPAWAGYAGPIHLQVSMPSDTNGGILPVLRTGRIETPDLIFLAADTGDRWRIGFRHETDLPVFSAPLPAAELRELSIAMGSALPTAAGVGAGLAPSMDRLRHQVSVLAGDRLVLHWVGLLQPSAPFEVVLGGRAAAPSGGKVSDATAQFKVEPVECETVLPKAAQVWLGADAEAVRWLGYPGPLRLRVRFPARPAGSNEPLVVTGKTGAGDFIFVRYLPDGRIALGHDHWGVGASFSEAVDPAGDTEHELIVSLGAFFPPDAAAPCYAANPFWREFREQHLVILDGKVLLSGVAATHPDQPEQIYAGVNPIGGSSADRFFSGEILAIGRVSAEQLQAALKGTPALPRRNDSNGKN